MLPLRHILSVLSSWCRCYFRDLEVSSQPLIEYPYQQTRRIAPEVPRSVPDRVGIFHFSLKLEEWSGRIVIFCSQIQLGKIPHPSAVHSCEGIYTVDSESSIAWGRYTWRPWVIFNKSRPILASNFFFALPHLTLITQTLHHTITPTHILSSLTSSPTHRHILPCKVSHPSGAK